MAYTAEPQLLTFPALEALPTPDDVPQPRPVVKRYVPRYNSADGLNGRPYRILLYPSWGGPAVDITDRVTAAEIRSGPGGENRVGGMNNPMQGNITLRDAEGALNPLSPAPGYDPFPGARVVMENRNGTVFDCHSAGVVFTSVQTGNDEAVMPLYGSLTKYGELYEGIFAKVQRNLTVSEAFDVAIDQLGSVSNLFSQHNVSDLLIYGTQLNNRGGLSQGRSRVPLTQAFQLLAQLEGGVIVEQLDSTVEFHGVNWRYSSGEPPITISPSAVATLEPYRLIVNLIESKINALISRGVQRLDFHEELPVVLQIPPGATAGITLNIDTNNGRIQLIESWEPFRSGTDYIADSSVTVDFQTEALSCQINCTNNDSVWRTVTIEQVRGEPFGPQFSNTLSVPNRRSIERYGPKQVVYPEGLLVNYRDAQARALRWVAEWGGLDANNLPHPPQAIKATVKVPPGEVGDYQVAKMLQPVRVDWITSKAVHANRWPGVVDGIQLMLDSQGSLTVNYTVIGTFQGASLVQPGVFGELLLGSVYFSFRGPERSLGSVIFQIPVYDEVLLGSVIFPGDRELLLGIVRFPDRPGEIHLGTVVFPAVPEILLGAVAFARPL